MRPLPKSAYFYIQLNDQSPSGPYVPWILSNGLLEDGKIDWGWIRDTSFLRRAHRFTSLEEALNWAGANLKGGYCICDQWGMIVENPTPHSDFRDFPNLFL